MIRLAFDLCLYSEKWSQSTANKSYMGISQSQEAEITEVYVAKPVGQILRRFLSEFVLGRWLLGWFMKLIRIYSRQVLCA